MVRRLSRKKISSFQWIIAGFLGVILLGTLLLLLPFAAWDGAGASIGDALFTATSAVCVTGLVVKDTATYWSAFGQTVILILIQIGGLGVVSVAALFAMVSGRKISLLQRSMLQDTISAHQIGGIVRMTRFILKIALIAEVTGALLMLPTFCGKNGPYGIWMSVFHSISAFCNAGFDIMGERAAPFSSLTSFAGDPGIVIPISLLIIIGGIGFLTWEDIAAHRHHFKSGLSYGITPTLGFVSRLILILLMFLGRVGGLTLIFAAINIKNTEVSLRPVEKIIVG